LFCLSSIGLTVSNKNTNYETSDIPYQDGWPRETIGRIVSSPVIADLDEDGKQEIIVGSGIYDDPGYKIYVFHSDGSYMDGWPISVTSPVWGSPSVGDLDNDGDLEIVIGDELTYIYAWHHDGTNVDGWPKPVGYFSASPTLYDIDGDGNLEIIIGSTEGVTDCATVSIWHHDGTSFEGWPQMITDYPFSLVEFSSPAVGDIDDDGDVEIVVGITAILNETHRGGYIYAWHHDGQLVNGWPVPAGSGMSIINGVRVGPALGDLDDDGDLEIVVSSDNGYVRVLHHDGSNVAGWPIKINYRIDAQSLADVDQDGKLEVISGSIDNELVYVWDGDGTLLDGWPQKAYGSVARSPSIGDISGDEHLEVIASSDKVYAWYYNGSIVPGFPLGTISGEPSTAPCLGDIDNDGDVEIIVGAMDKKLYVWDLPHPFKLENMEWPMYQHDVYHTGDFSFGRGFVADANGPYYNRIDNENMFIGTVLNGDPPFKWNWDFGDGNSSYEQNPSHVYTMVGDYLVNLTITDALGNKAYDTGLVHISLFGRDESGALRVSLKGGLGVTLLIENNATVNAEGIQWSIKVDDEYYEDICLVLYPENGTKTGVIDIPAGESKSIWCFIYKKNGFPYLLSSFKIPFIINASVKIMDCIAYDSMRCKILMCFVDD